MFALILVGVLSAASLSILDWHWRRGRGAAEYVLAVLPIALLFLTIPPSAAVVGLIRGFQHIGESGLTGAAAVLPLCVAIWRSLWFGGTAFLLMMCVGAALQVHRGRLTIVEEMQIPESESVPRSNWRTVLLGVCATLTIPVGIYVDRTRQIPILVMRAAERAERMERLTTDELGQMSQTIATQAILAVMIGVALSLILLACGFAVLAAPRRHSSDRLRWYSWAALILSGLVISWGMTRVSADWALLETVGSR